MIGVIILLYKRNERNLAKNYRPICLLSTIFKIIQYLILNRIDEKIELWTSNMQMAFRKKTSTQKSIFIRKHMLRVEKH